MPRLATVLLCLFSFLPACTATHQMREGMTKKEVSTKLGPPLRIDHSPNGRETWIYNTVTRTRSTGWQNNYSQPGESVYERDLRLETQDPGGIVAINTTEHYEERPLRFDSNGRLLSSPPFEFLPNR